MMKYLHLKYKKKNVLMIAVDLCDHIDNTQPQFVTSNFSVAWLGAQLHSKCRSDWRTKYSKFGELVKLLNKKLEFF